MNIHPLFAGFKGESPYAVGAALGFAIHVETALGQLPAALDPQQRERTREGGDLAGFQFAGGWGAPGAHCLMFAKPLTRLAATWWQAGEFCIDCHGSGFCLSLMGEEIRCPCGAPIKGLSVSLSVSGDVSGLDLPALMNASRSMSPNALA